MSEMTLPKRPLRSEWVAEAIASLSLSWPLILTNSAETAMTATDVLVMGHLGANALAAGALGVNLYFAFMIFGIGLVTASAPMIASAIGARRHSVREVRRTVRQGLWSAIVLSIPTWIALWNSSAILRFLGQDPELSEAAAGFIRTLQWSILPFLGFIVLRSFVSALERPLWALAAILVAVVVNAFGNWVLVFGHLGFPAMGLPGSGLATTIGNCAAFLCLAVVLSTDRRFRRYHLFGRFLKPDWPRFRAFWRLGLPIGAALGFEVTIFNAAALLMGLISTTALAAHAIAIQIVSITFMIPLGLGQAVTVRVGRAYGAGDRTGISRAGWTAFVLGLIVMVILAIVMVTIPRQLIGLFVDRADPANDAVVEMATLFLALAALFQIADGSQAVGAGMLRGVHDTRVPMVIAAVGYWGIGMPASAALAFWGGLAGSGVWLGLALGLFIVAALFLARWLHRDRFLDARFATLTPP